MVRLAQERAKRKSFGEVYDEFSLSAPAWKSRRLDMDLLPVVEDELSAPLSFSTQVSNEQATSSLCGIQDASPMPMEDMPVDSPNEERALVLYRPVGNAQLLSPYHANVSFKVNSDMIHSLKNQIFKAENQNVPMMGEQTAMSNDSLALVPWVSPNLATVNTCPVDSIESQIESSDPMDTEVVVDGASVEIDEEVECPVWQQHCMTPQPLPRAPSPVMWSW